MNGSKSMKMSKKVVACLLTILLLAAPVKEPLFFKEAKAAEIGMVGALSGSTTLWEIFQTLFVAGGVIVASEEIQNAAANNLGSTAYTLEEMESLGFIRVPEGGSNALDWDWSGLEQKLQDTENSADTKIIKGVFGEPGGSGQGGGDEDPWYKKAINWAKAVVNNGAVKVNQTLSGTAGQVTMTLTSLASMLSSYSTEAVRLGVPITKAQGLSANGVFGATCYCSYYYQGNYYEKYEGIVSNDGDLRLFYTYDKTISGTSTSNFIQQAWALRDATDSATVFSKTFINGYLNASAEHTVTNRGIYRLSNISQSGYPSSGQPFFYACNGYEKTYVSGINISTIARSWASTGETDAIEISPYSPDIMTPNGYAQVPNGQPSWVPTPYVQPGKQLEILPQPKIDEFTQYVIEEVPEFSPAGEAWSDTVNPYIENEPVPTPSPRPRPTQKPDVTTIPSGDPGGEDNPVNVTDPDPMPDIEGGFATTYGLMDFFPFCIPSDIVTIYKLFETEEDARAAPYIDWNLKIDRFGVDEHIVLDFSIFDSSAAVCRVLMFITFCFGLLLATKQLIWS